MSGISNADLFRQSFREEAREILVDLEAALLELHDNPEDKELVGRVFRGLHTIKGSGAMFGFEDLAAFTHNLENAYDEVRNERLAVSPELVDLTLAALDQMRAMLEEERGPEVKDSAIRIGILDQVRRLAGLSAKGPEGRNAAAEVPQPEKEATGPLREWAIHFAPAPEFMLNGSNPLLLLSELREMGGLALRASMASVPPLAEMDPERCYVSWEMMLATAEDRDAIRDVFIFVEDRCELTIGPVSNSIAGPASGTPDSKAVANAADQTARALAEARTGRGGRRDYDSPDIATSLRVPAHRLDQIVDLVGELVTVQARLSELAARNDNPEIAAISEEVERLTSSLRENSINIRMIPVRATFEKFRRLVHDLARDLGKNVELSIEGAETELDKTVIDQLGDPLMHLIRNSMDHGIELPERRARSGKRPVATIHLSARHSGASVLISVSDDGGGIDTEAVRARAIERGLAAPEAHLTEAEIFAFLFQPGFSTAEKVTDISGRGVGMDVVRQRVDSLRGSIEVTSKPGQGTTVTLRLPLTLAIIDGLLVSVGEACFVLPLATTLECIELTGADIERANGKHMANVRGEIVPYISLREHFGISSVRPLIEQIMIVETEQGRYGFVVDRVLGNCQTVIKNLGRFYRHVQVVSGATILGNGTVALILDPERLVQQAVSSAAEGQRCRQRRAAR